MHYLVRGLGLESNSENTCMPVSTLLADVRVSKSGGMWYEQKVWINKNAKTKMRHSRPGNAATYRGEHDPSSVTGQTSQLGGTPSQIRFLRLKLTDERFRWERDEAGS